MQNKKTNWWVVIAILIIGIPVGYVGTGIVKKMVNKDEVVITEPKNKVKEDSVNIATSIDEKKEDSVATEPVPIPKPDVVSEEKTEKVQERPKEVVRQQTTDNVDEVKTPPQPTPKKLSLSVKPGSLAYAVNGGSKTISITSNTDWQLSISGGEDWLRANSTNGNGNKTVTLVAQESKVTSQRNATIEVRWTDQNGDEHTNRINASQAAYVHVPEPITVAEAQAIISAGKTDSRIPDNCKMVGNAVNTNYKQFRTNVSEKRYVSVKVESVSHDKKGNASQVKVTVVRPKPDIPVPPPSPIITKEEVQGIVAKGQMSSKVTDDCSVVVNGRNTTDYQAFRQGVNYRAYSNVRVTEIKTNSSGKVISIRVTATESKDND